MAYNQPLDHKNWWRIMRVKLWEMGHTFEEIDNLPLEDLGDIVGYLNEKQRGEDYHSKRNARMSAARKNARK